MDKKGSFGLIFLAMFASILIAAFWNSLPIIKNSVNAVLNPTAGALMNWNLTIGMTILVFILSVFMTIIQKYTTDQKTLREIKAEHKRLSDEAKKFSHDPQKMMDFNKKIMPLSMQMLSLSMRSIIYTAIPIILLFRWFTDYFALVDFKFFGFFSWFWFYLLGSILFSSILRKVMKVV